MIAAYHIPIISKHPTSLSSSNSLQRIMEKKKSGTQLPKTQATLTIMMKDG